MANAAISLLAGLAGAWLVHANASLLKTDPVWQGPAVVAGIIALLVCVALLLPTLLRNRRQSHR